MIMYIPIVPMIDPDLWITVRVTLLICKCKKYHYAQLNNQRRDAAMLSYSKVESSSTDIAKKYAGYNHYIAYRDFFCTIRKVHA